MRAFFLRGNILDVRAVDFGTSTTVATLVVSGQEPSVLDVDGRRAGVEEEQGVGAVRRRWVAVVLIVLAVPFVVLAGMRLVGADGDKYTIAALALTPYAAVGEPALDAVALLLRSWWTGGIVLLLAAMMVACMSAADQPRASRRQPR
jgi:hypothetical protein